jgi:uncharacterized delta-60 repeat protein
MRKLIIIFIASFLLNSGSLFAQAGLLDISFDPGSGPGINTNVSTIAVQSDKKIIIGGTFYTYNGIIRSYLARLNEDGNLDSSFISGIGPNSQVISLVIQPDGKILIVGQFTLYDGIARNRIARVNSDGTLDLTFNPGTGANAAVSTILLQTDGKMIISGTFTSYNGTARNRIARVNSDGTLDTLFNAGSGINNNGNIPAIFTTILQPDGRIVVGGAFTTFNGIPKNHIVRLEVDGTLDSTFNQGAGPYHFMNNARIQTTAIQQDGKIVIGGSFTEYNGTLRNHIARINTDGTLDTLFNPGQGASDVVSRSIIQADGKIIITGLFFYFDQSSIGLNLSARHIVRINMDGSQDQSFDPGTAFNPNGYTGALALQPDAKMLVAGSFTSYNGVLRNKLARIHLNSITAIETIAPNKGGNNGNLLLNIHGRDFPPVVQVKLTRNGSPDIIVPDSSIEIFNSRHIIVPLELNGRDTGDYNVIVTVPGDTVMTLPNSFKVETGILPELNVSILGPQSFRLNQWQNYQIIVTNTGNTAALAVPLFIIVSQSNVEIDYQLGDLITLPVDSLNFDTIPPYVIIDSLFEANLNQAYYVFPLIVSAINGNETKTFTIKVKPTALGAVELYSWAGRSFVSIDSSIFNARQVNTCTEDMDKAQCMISTMFNVLGIFPALSCVSSIFSNSLSLFMDATCGRAQANTAVTLVRVITDVAVSCSPIGVFTAFAKAGKIVREIVKQGLREYPVISWAGPVTECTDAFKPKTPLAINKPVAVTSVDPNDKYGPVGEGSVHYLNSNYNLPYQISFENLDSATAAAQTVIIIDSLDMNTFDISTFELGFVSIGDSVHIIPQGLKEYETDIFLGPSNNIIARVEARVDTITGVVTWTFTSLDPTTLQVTTDPLAGFLPPNLIEPEGEGSVAYTIKTWDTLSTNTVIKNKAYIIFDVNSPIITNEWSNTEDDLSPMSQMYNLPPVVYNDSSIILSYSGSDFGSGIRNYEIYYSVNSGPFQIFTYSSDTSVLFTGNMVSTYSFFSIAIDSVGNRENMKTIAEATISFTVGSRDLDSDVFFELYPNPTSKNIQIEIQSTKSHQYQLIITDIYGKRINSQLISISEGRNLFFKDIDVPGIYFISLESSEYKSVKKIVITN